MILVLGGSGKIGWKLVNTLIKLKKDVHYTYYSNKVNYYKELSHKLDITQTSAVFDLITFLKPEVTIHTSALTNVDLCEVNRELAYSINIKGTKNVIDACKMVKSKLIFISTSNVFYGKKIYSENDLPNPINYYGYTKYQGEKMTIKSQLSYLILRTDQPYSWVEKWQKKSFVETILEQYDTDKQIQIFKDWYNNPTYIDDFVDATIRLIKQKNEGIYHLVGPDYINRYDWAIKIAKCFKKDHSLICPILSKEKGLPAKRANTNLSNLKIKRDTQIDFKGVDEGLKQMLLEKDVACV